MSMVKGDISMSLLWMEYETEFKNLVDAAFESEQNAKSDYFSKLSNKALNIIYRDTKYNIDFLYTAFVLQEEKIMEDYARWLYHLMDSILKVYTPEEMTYYVNNHLECIKIGIKKTIDPEKQDTLIKLVEHAQKMVEDEAKKPVKEGFEPTKYEEKVQEYMDALFEKNTRKALFLIQKYLQEGISVTDIYIEILAESMRRVGELWHTAKITVDTEHYCTSTTQMAMAQMYGVIFDHEPKNKTMLCACPGTELHEMGARMVSDLFENDGWDSIYLGAAVPEDALLESVRESTPDLIALSVTMPQHLIDCKKVVDAIRNEFPNAVIAVGGKAFESTDEIWKKWPVDFYANDARDLLAKANEIVMGS